MEQTSSPEQEKARDRRERRKASCHIDTAEASGNLSLLFDSARSSRSSITDSSVFFDIASSLTSRYRERSSIFFSRKLRGLDCARRRRPLRTMATSRREPVRILSEFSLNRSFQSALFSHLPSLRNSMIFSTSPLRTTLRRPTLSTLWNGTITFS